MLTAVIVATFVVAGVAAAAPAVLVATGSLTSPVLRLCVQQQDRVVRLFAVGARGCSSPRATATAATASTAAAAAPAPAAATPTCGSLALPLRRLGSPLVCALLLLGPPR